MAAAKTKNSLQILL